MNTSSLTYTNTFDRVDAVEQSPTKAYVNWLENELDSGRWSSDPTQPSLLYKVYSDVTRVPLDARVPLHLVHSEVGRETSASSKETLMQRLAWLLWYTHGLVRVMRPAPGSLPVVQSSDDTTSPFPHDVTGPKAASHPFMGRPVPSGGGLHSVEIYVALGTQWGITPGIYHYDCTHHALELLREGNYLSEIGACLSAEYRASFSAVLFTSAFFQKNHQKYAELSYQLQTLETGIVVEQMHHLANYFAFDLAVHLQFADAPLHKLLGLDPVEESVYAVLPFSTHASSIVSSEADMPPAIERESATIATHQCLDATHIQPFPLNQTSTLLKDLYRASLQQSVPLQDYVSTPSFIPDDAWTPLPEASSKTDQDLAQVLLRHRRTSFSAIDTRSLSRQEFATSLSTLQETVSDLWTLCDCRLYCAVRSVDELTPGVYLYNEVKHAITCIYEKDVSALLARLTTAPNIQSHFAPVNFFITGDYLKARTYFGERGLRMMGIRGG